ncbi:hypothetical protein BDZ94DRAFT_1324126 [Collybia nuda]|uniref:Uncharacterized protein n=1 Tax=Collybia nuda TaxID=64659 RepID=A0A9P5Y0G8_9AGAR|nr:hypothetical protein BDZ94DRAFT_1324126 [Collybia nuda]
MAHFRISEAQIISLFLESVAWGILLICFISCMKTLLFTPDGVKRRGAINWQMLSVSVLTFLVATFDISIALYHNIVAFVQFTGPGGPDAELTNISDWVNVMKTADVVISTMLGDGMLFYRCWIIYQRSWLAAFPSLLLWLACLGLGISVIYFESTLHSRILVNANQLVPLITAYLAGTIVLNVITTFLIVWRLWRVERTNRRHGLLDASGVRSQLFSVETSKRRSKLMDVAFTLVESGMIYTVTTVITFITYVVKNNAVYVVSSVGVQAVGIAFDLIIIRSVTRQTNEADRAYDASHSIQFVRSNAALGGKGYASRGATQEQDRGNTIPMQIMVSQSQDRISGDFSRKAG